MRTRIAPTPSGYIHMGNMYSFILTWLMARKYNADIILRIDDLDQIRTRKEYVEHILQVIEWMKIPISQGPSTFTEFKDKYSQVHREEEYSKALDVLIKKGLVYPCSCSRADLQNHVIYPGTCRKRPMESYFLEDSLRIKYEKGDFVIKRKEGMVAYQLASIIDDEIFEIDMIVRGEDLRESSELQKYLAELLGLSFYPKAKIIHHQLLMNESFQKLSKSNQDNSIQHFLEGNFSKFLSEISTHFLGNNMKVDSISHLEELFWKSELSKSYAKF